MPPDREQLQIFADENLVGQSVDVSWNIDHRAYMLTELLSNQGKTSVTWKARDGFERQFAIKFVLREEYSSHSLEAEMLRANSLDNPLFAKIDFFGEPALSDCDHNGRFYAIVVEWVEARTLKEYLSDPATEIDPEAFLGLSRDMCTALQILKARDLVHNDLHDENLLVRSIRDSLTEDESVQLIVIDTGHLKTVERWFELVDSWREKIQTLEEAKSEANEGVDNLLRRYHGLVDYFNRTDQQWIVYHLTQLYNCMRGSLPTFQSASKHFVLNLPDLLEKMIDADPSRRMDDPRQMYREIESVWNDSTRQPGAESDMSTPFDLPSAELIRNDRQLMELFSDDYPGLDLCRSESPVYLYGPRGCGKSTILRSLSLKAALASRDPGEAISKVSFTGVYISSSQELRSRFWLMRPEDFELLDGHLVQYFTLLLIEALVDTLDRMFHSDIGGGLEYSFGMSEDAAARCMNAVRNHLVLDAAEPRYARTSCLTALRQQIRRLRDNLWLRILSRTESSFRPNAQLIFDLCQDVEEVCPYLREHRICFLIDDYSNQRIPAALQRKLNQAITFSKQGSPIFKVTSEYDGVDLEGVQEGREVNEVNVGFRYVSFQNDSNRYRFLANVLQRRFSYLRVDSQVADFLPPSELKPTIPLARAIRKASDQGHRFYYHGIDTISDLCSGDFAMGIDLVRRIFEQGAVDWRKPAEQIPPHVQDAAIREYTKQEFEYIRFHSKDGRRKRDIADSLCWLSSQCVLTKETEKTEAKKGGKRVAPVIKNHLDISEKALRELEQTSPSNAQLLRELVSKGILFPIQDSRSREGHHATRRLMIRRILLARYRSALGRDLPIRIDDVQRLTLLLTEPAEFAKYELARTSSRSTPPSNGKNQKTLPFGDPVEDDRDG